MSVVIDMSDDMQLVLAKLDNLGNRFDHVDTDLYLINHDIHDITDKLGELLMRVVIAEDRMITHIMDHTWHNNANNGIMDISDLYDDAT